MATPTLDPKTSDTVQALVQLLRSRSSEEIRQRMYDNPPGSPWWAACKTELDLRNSERAATALVDTSRILDKMRSATDHLDELTNKLLQATTDMAEVVKTRARIRPADGNRNLRDRGIDHRAAVLYSLSVFHQALDGRNPTGGTPVLHKLFTSLLCPRAAASVTIARVANYIGAIDQGTTSTRFCVFDAAGKTVASAQKEHEQIYPQPGWVEHDPEEIWRSTQDVIAQALEQGKLRAADLAAIGITNQRETTVLWEPEDRQARGQRAGLAGHASR